MRAAWGEWNWQSLSGLRITVTEKCLPAKRGRDWMLKGRPKWMSLLRDEVHQSSPDYLSSRIDLSLPRTDFLSWAGFSVLNLASSSVSARPALEPSEEEKEKKSDPRVSFPGSVFHCAEIEAVIFAEMLPIIAVLSTALKVPSIWQLIMSGNRHWPGKYSVANGCLQSQSK